MKDDTLLSQQFVRTWNGDAVMYALQEIEKLLPILTRAEKAQVLAVGGPRSRGGVSRH